MFTFLAFVGSLYIHLGPAMWGIPADTLLKYSLVLALLFLGLGLWTYIPYIKQLHAKSLVVLAFFVATVHIVYWPCTLLMGRTYALPTIVLATSSCLLFAMLVGWRGLVQLSQPLIRTYVVHHTS